MLENIKHSIVLLQIAKNTAHPINGIYQGPGPSKLDSQDTLGRLAVVTPEWQNTFYTSLQFPLLSVAQTESVSVDLATDILAENRKRASLQRAITGNVES